jgi:hypothetical protein
MRRPTGKERISPGLTAVIDMCQAFDDAGVLLGEVSGEIIQRTLAMTSDPESQWVVLTEIGALALLGLRQIPEAQR